MSVEAVTTTVDQLAATNAVIKAADAVAMAAVQSNTFNWSDLIVAGVGLGGVLLGAGIQITANRHEARRIQDAELKTLKRHRVLSAKSLARHLENFTEHCVEVISTDVAWTSPYSWQQGSDPIWLDPLAAWPDQIDWRLIDVDLEEKASNFQNQIRRERQYLVGSDQTQEDDHWDHLQMATRFGIEAWQLAVEVRENYQLKPYDWPEGWSGIEILRIEAVRQAKLNADRAKENERLWAIIQRDEARDQQQDSNS